MSTLGTVDFGRAWRRRIIDTLRSETGDVPINIIAVPDLIQSKRDAGRHKDLDDVEHLIALHGSRAARRTTRPRARRRHK